jgi:hypothetical protein
MIVNAPQNVHSLGGLDEQIVNPGFESAPGYAPWTAVLNPLTINAICGTGQQHSGSCYLLVNGINNGVFQGVALGGKTPSQFSMWYSAAIAEAQACIVTISYSDHADTVINNSPVLSGGDWYSLDLKPLIESTNVTRITVTDKTAIELYLDDFTLKTAKPRNSLLLCFPPQS